MCTIFVGISYGASLWRFYVPSAKRSYILLDTDFDELFISPLALQDLLFQGVIKLYGTWKHILNQDTHYGYVDTPTSQQETVPYKEHDMPHYSRKHTNSDVCDLVSYPKKGNYEDPEEARYTTK